MCGMGELCEGDAAVPIRAALAEGRLCDFFLLVRSVLETYNPHSAHVTLNDWYGSPCYDCGGITDDDRGYFCEGCDHDFCEDCISSCRCCDDSRCVGCLDDCPHCDEPTCGGCLKTCNDCRKPCCRNCLDDGICPACLEKKNKNPQHKDTTDDDNDSIPSAQPAGIAGISRGAGGQDTSDDSPFDDAISQPPQSPAAPAAGTATDSRKRREFVMPREPVLRFSPYAWSKLLFFCHYGDTEIGGFGISDPDDLLFIRDFQSVHQMVSSVTVAFDDTAVADFFEEQVDLGASRRSSRDAGCIRILARAPRPAAKMKKP